MNVLRRRWPYAAITIGTLAGVFLFAQLIFAMQADFDGWKAWCASEGGRVIDQHNTSTGVGYVTGNGKPGSGGAVVTTTTSTTYYCISEDGGILDIR